jgi:hypothetical protein
MKMEKRDLMTPMILTGESFKNGLTTVALSLRNSSQFLKLKSHKASWTFKILMMIMTIENMMPCCCNLPK